jgi:hypothetical protein
MAKLKDLAGLAALGMLGYKLSQKNKDDAGKLADSSSYAPSSNMTPMKGVGDATNDVATDNTSAGVLKAITAPKAVPNDQASNQGVVGGSTPSPKPKPKRTGMTGAQNTALANAGKQAKMAAESDALAKANTGASKTTPPAATPSTRPTTRPTNILEEAKEEARRRAAASQATPTSTSTSSSTSPTTRYSFPGSSALNKKNGGAVKMSSGGMASSASKRADGCATKGKTKGRFV